MGEKVKTSPLGPNVLQGESALLVTSSSATCMASSSVQKPKLDVDTFLRSRANSQTTGE
jgi:hypothetical protein